jgi:immunity protein 53 of polymorphic toxin system
MGDDLKWLQHWFLAHCDGEWEHGSGITIETLDNPGWHVTINLDFTELQSAPFEPIVREATEADWIHCRVIERKAGPVPYGEPNFRRFEGAGGPLNLPEILATFRAWAERGRG